jgi:hypothetical protein
MNTFAERIQHGRFFDIFALLNLVMDINGEYIEENFLHPEKYELVYSNEVEASILRIMRRRKHELFGDSHDPSEEQWREWADYLEENYIRMIHTDIDPFCILIRHDLLLIRNSYGSIIDTIEWFKSIGMPYNFDERKFNSNFMNIMRSYNSDWKLSISDLDLFKVDKEKIEEENKKRQELEEKNKKRLEVLCAGRDKYLAKKAEEKRIKEEEEKRLLRLRKKEERKAKIIEERQRIVTENYLMSFPFPYINDEIGIKFINDYRIENGHLPMFYILCNYLKIYGHLQCIDNLSKAYCVYMEYEHVKYGPTEEIWESYGITRVQAKAAMRKHKPNRMLKLILDHEDWNYYEVRNMKFISKDNFDIELFCKTEKVKLNFVQFFFMLKLVYNRYGLCRIYTEDLEPFRESKDSVYCYDYIIYEDFNIYNFSDAIKDLSKIANLHKLIEGAKTIQDDYIMNEKYWDIDLKEKMPAFDIHNIYRILFTIFNDVMGEWIKNNKDIFIEDNFHRTPNVKSILKEASVPLTCLEVFQTYTKDYPEDKTITLEKVRSILKSNSKIIRRGDIYNTKLFYKI